MNKLKRKAESAGGKVEFLDTKPLKLSQYNYISASYFKKPLSQRPHVLDSNTIVQRDIYSAFLALCAKESTHAASHIENDVGNYGTVVAAGGPLVQPICNWKTQLSNGGSATVRADRLQI